MDNRLYLDKFKLRVSDYDCHDQLLISSILDLCQDVAGNHANKLGVGFNDMIAQNKIWMVIRTKIEIEKYPPFSSEVVIKTWPIAPNKVDMDREYIIQSLDGEEYVKVTSKWVVCDVNTRRLLRAKEAAFNLDIYIEERLFDEPFNKIEFDNSKEINIAKVKTNYLDLDHNGHINNVKYANFMLLGIKELQNRAIKKFQIDYLHELKENEEVVINYYLDNNVIYVKGYSLEQESFTSRIELE
jgi:acyl-ACP thioesterase